MFKPSAKWIWGGGLGLLAGTLSLHPLSQSDGFWHMTLGRAVWRAGARHVPEPTALPGFAESVSVPEWLFDLVVYGVHQAAGLVGLSLWIGFSALMATLALCWMLRTLRRDADPAAFAWVSALVVALLMARMTLRPQLAFMIVLPVFIAFVERYRTAPRDSRIGWAAALLGLQVLWAQLHGSFVLGPAIFAAGVLPDVIRERGTSDWPAHAAVLAALMLGFASSADGFGVFQYVLSHASGDAARHVGDMPATRWENLSPISPYGVAWWLLWATALVGGGVERGARARFVLLAGLGLALTLNSVRFIAVGALLLAPLALDGAHAMASRAPRWPLRGLPSTVVGIVLVLWSGQVTHLLRGPVGELGLAPGRDPVAAARFLAERVPGPSVLSTFDTGASIGFWLDGHVRTYVDTRTPLHFDDTEYAVAREVWRKPQALALALERYEIDAILTERDWATCWNVPDGWVPAVIEMRHTTFVRDAEADPFVALSACGSSYLSESACRDEGALLDIEIQRLAEWGESPFLDYLRVQRILRCGGEIAEAAQLLPDERVAWSMRRERTLAAALVAARSGEPDRALELLDALARQGDPLATRMALGTFAARPGSRAEVQAMLEKAIHVRADDTPLDLRAALAMMCIQAGDADCVRFHGLRVAVAGDPDAGRVLLDWLREHHPDAEVRDDAGHWLRSLERREAETVADRMHAAPEAG